MEEWIEEKTRNGDINYFEYEEFSDKVEIGKGGFGVVYKVNWRSKGMEVAALKSLLNDNNTTSINRNKFDEFIRELKLIRNLHFHPNINQFYGVTQDRSGNYMMVLQYANEGTLRDYLGNEGRFNSLQWNDKIRMALDIAKGLQCLHDNQIIHRDLHSKNILVNDSKLMIADLGLSKQLDISSNSTGSEVIGILEYIDPWCLKNNRTSKDKSSDIYSLGILLWEITSGHPPYRELGNRGELKDKICKKGYRENPIEGTPSNYVKLYNKCWNGDPKRRPKINEVSNILSRLLPKYDNEDESLPKTNTSCCLIKFNEEIKIKLDDTELFKLVYEVFQGYTKRNNVGKTKKFDFEYILRKYELQSTCLFNYLLKNRLSTIHQVVIGTFYKVGVGVGKNEKESFKWFEKASQKGDINGHFELGECYYNGIGIEKNLEKALEYYQLAARNGLNIALFTLAKHNYNIKHKPKDTFSYYKQAAKKGFVQSQYYVAKCYNHSYGKKGKENKALTWFKKYQENAGSWDITNEIEELEADSTKSSKRNKDGNPSEAELNKALNEIVVNYKKNNEVGTTKKLDFKYTLEKYGLQSEHIFKHLKGNQDPSTMHKVVIGIFYKKGFGVERNEEESFKSFENASQEGDINSQFELGECHYNGIGTEKDYKKALKYYKLAANKGLNIALFTLANYYYNIGNKSKAFSYYKKSAKEGFVQSQYYVAKCYNDGHGKKRNECKAISWFDKYQNNDGSWEISSEITEVKEQSKKQKEGTSITSFSRK